MSVGKEKSAKNRLRWFGQVGKIDVNLGRLGIREKLEEDGWTGLNETKRTEEAVEFEELRRNKRRRNKSLVNVQTRL